jgi:hypothetical protein
MKARWVHIPMNCRSQLPKHGERVEQAHFCFAKLFPRAYVFWCISLKANSVNFTNHFGFHHNIQEIGVTNRGYCVHEPSEKWLLCY